MKDYAIGIFDSGIGGLTVAKAIKDLLPNEQIIYFGDTAHLPYGEKSESAIQKYSERITQFLLKRKCKCIVIACNTASAFARQNVKTLAGNKIVQNVIDPIAKEAVSSNVGGKIGVIATKGTTESANYPIAIKELNSDIEVASLATPLLVPMIEEGFFNNNISHVIIDNYLTDPVLKNIDQIILGCTHFPLIEKEIQEVYREHGREVQIINSAEVVARSLKNELQKSNLLNNQVDPRHEFYVSDYTESFEKSTKQFFGEQVHLEELDIWSKNNNLL